jgi:hypothetical protein
MHATAGVAVHGQRVRGTRARARASPPAPTVVARNAIDDRPPAGERIRELAHELARRRHRAHPQKRERRSRLASGGSSSRRAAGVVACGDGVGSVSTVLAGVVVLHDAGRGRVHR